MTDPEDRTFQIHPDMPGRLRRRGSAIVADSASIVGDVRMGRDVGVWFNVTIRGDDASIEIGDEVNVQDNTCIHVDVGAPMVIGRGVTIGHSATVHGVEIGEYALIGMGATILGGSRIGAFSIIGAGALVRENAIIPPRSVVLGMPGEIRRQVTDEEVAEMRWRARHYVQRAESYLLPEER